MSTNPNNSVGTNGAYGGRTSVNALNDNLAAYSRGILSGWVCSPNSGLTVSLGGDGTTRDVAIAEDNAGNKTTINNISGSPIDVTLSAAPGSNSRIDLIVAYVDNPPQGTDTETDNPGACGIIAVNGNAALSPTAPDDSAIRTAITADGASGPTAYYVVLASITVASGTTDITASNISSGDKSYIDINNVFLNTFIPSSTGVEITTNMMYNNKTVYVQRFAGSTNITASMPKDIILIASGIDSPVFSIGWAQPNTSLSKSIIGSVFVSGDGTKVSVNGGDLVLVNSSNELVCRITYMNGGTATYDFVVYYTKV